MFGNWGTVGIASPVRGLAPIFRDAPVDLAVYTPPSGQAASVYMKYANVDLVSAEFRSEYLRALATSDSFASSVLQLEANYGGFTGADVRRALVEDEELIDANLGDPRSYEGRPYQLDSNKDRALTLGTMIVDLSISLTSAMLASGHSGATPITDDPNVANLLGLRVSATSYVSRASYLTLGLGFEIARAVIPDEALQQLTIAQILEYRKRAGAAYRSWITELNNLASTLYDVPSEELAIKVPQLIASRVLPQIREYENEMKDIADQMYGDIIKRAIAGASGIPVISLALGASISIEKALLEFAGWMGTAMAPIAIKRVLDQRRIERKHALAYLLKLTPAS